jgi:hypothetical protein
MKNLQAKETEVVSQGRLFDYAALGVEDSVIVQQRTSEIKSLANRVASSIVEMGGKLVEVRERLKEGKFKEWLDAEFPNWSQRSAYNFIAVWEQYSSADFAIDGIAPSALYLLAAPSTPTSARKMAKQLVEAGQGVSHSTAKELVRQAKERGPKQVEKIEELKEAEDDDVGPEYEFEREPAGEKTLAIPSAPEAEKSEPQELPAGWTWAHRDARVPSYRAENLVRNLRTITLRTEAEVIRAAHEIEAAGREGLLGLTGKGLVSQGTAPQEPVAIAGPAPASSTAIERHAAWYKTRIEISITFMPGGDAGTRKVMHTVRAGDGSDDMPFVAMSSGEAELLEMLSPITRGLVEKAAEAFAKKQAAKSANSTQKKPTAKKSAAKSKVKEGKK